MIVKAGPSFDKLREAKIRRNESYDDPIDLYTGSIEVKMTGEWNDNGRIAIRQESPLPLTVLAVTPYGMIGG